MGKYIIATIKTWNIENARKITKMRPDDSFLIITEKNEMTIDNIKRYNPDMIFFPHWSWFIPEEIFEEYESIVFHMTDLPYGRGGSPLQNLIVNGIYNTKISALKVERGLDEGPIYLKEDLYIGEGNADELLKKASDIVFNVMIPQLIDNKISPVKQIGDVEVFKRRTPEQSEIPKGLTQRQLYDYIRMLDGEGYPTAFLKTDYGKIYLKNASFKNGITRAEGFIVGEDRDE